MPFCSPHRKIRVSGKRIEMKIITRAASIRLFVLAFSTVLLSLLFILIFLKMPNAVYRGASENYDELAEQLKSDVEYLADKIGPRNLTEYSNLRKAADFIESSFKNMGYKVNKYNYKAQPGLISKKAWAGTQEQIYTNIEAELPGTVHPEQIVILGAHYDSVPLSKCRGANDNASGIAGVLAMARLFAKEKPARTIRFAAFVNEEPPFFQTASMGSFVYACQCRKKKENICAMFCLDTIGYFSENDGSQNYPPPLQLFYPSKGNFIAFVSNISSVGLLRKSIKVFKANSPLPAEGAAVPGIVPGSNWSDHCSFWQNGYSALLITDTALYRYPFYHQNNDDSDKINYNKTAQLIKGLQAVLKAQTD